MDVKDSCYGGKPVGVVTAGEVSLKNKIISIKDLVIANTN